MAFLRKDRTIVFESVSEFLTHHDSHMTKSGLLLQSHLNWPMRETNDFLIRIEGREEQASIKAEVVFCGGGNVGLQLDPDPETRMSLLGLVDALRSAPVLKDDGTILYASLKKFREDYESTVSSGGLYLESKAKWPLNQRMTFPLRIAGFSRQLQLSAQPVFCEGGLTCLRLDNDPETRGAIERFVAEAQAALPARAPAQAVAEDAAKAQGGSAPAEPEEETLFPECRGTVVPARRAAELARIELAKLDPGKHHDLSLFALMATLSYLKEPLGLTLTAGDKDHRLQFNRKGQVVSYEGPRADIRLLEQLTKNRYIDRAQIDSVIAAVGPGKPAAKLVLEQKLANAKQVAISLGDLLVEVLEELRANREMIFVVEGMPTDLEEGSGFGEILVPWMERALKALPPEEIKPLLAGMWKKYPKLASDPIWSPSLMEMDDEQFDFTKSLSGAKTLPGALEAFSKKDRDRLMRLALTLRAAGTVVVLENPGDAEPESRRPVIAKPSGGRKVDKLKKILPKGPEKVEKREVVLKLEQELAKMEEASMFDHLGVHWSAHPGMYERAMQEIHLKYGRDSTLAKDSQEAAHLCHKRIELARRAQHYLSTLSRRMEYRKSVVPYSHLKNTSLMLVDKAEQAALAKNFVQAIPIMEVAVELDPTPAIKAKLDSLRKRAKR